MAINSTNFINGSQFRISDEEFEPIITDLKKLVFQMLKENGY